MMLILPMLAAAGLTALFFATEPSDMPKLSPAQKDRVREQAKAVVKRAFEKGKASSALQQGSDVLSRLSVTQKPPAATSTALTKFLSSAAKSAASRSSKPSSARPTARLAPRPTARPTARAAAPDLSNLSAMLKRAAAKKKVAAPRREPATPRRVVTRGRTPAQAAAALYKYVTETNPNPRTWGVRNSPNSTIMQLQREMGGITADGIYGPATRARGRELIGKSFPPRV